MEADQRRTIVDQLLGSNDIGADKHRSEDGVCAGRPLRHVAAAIVEFEACPFQQISRLA